MSQQTKSEVLLQLRRQYRRAGRDLKRQLLTQAVQLLGYHRKAAIRALRQQFGYERYDNPPVVPLINALGQGALGQLQNHFLPTHKLEQKVRRDGRTMRVYGPAQTPLARVLAAPQVRKAKKTELRTLHAGLNLVPTAPGHRVAEAGHRSHPVIPRLNAQPG